MKKEILTEKEIRAEHALNSDYRTIGNPTGHHNQMNTEHTMTDRQLLQSLGYAIPVHWRDIDCAQRLFEIGWEPLDDALEKRGWRSKLIRTKTLDGAVSFDYEAYDGVTLHCNLEKCATRLEAVRSVYEQIYLKETNNV